MANLRNIAVIGFDTPLSLNSLSLTEHGHGGLDSHAAGDGSRGAEIVATSSRMDHPKLTAQGVHFLKGVDLSIPELAGELAFADALAVRNNPTTLDNIHRKLTLMPPSYHEFSKEQQEAYCKLVDYAEMKQALRLELRSKEKLIREQEMKYLTTDYGLGNVVHGWDITNPTGPGGLTDRQASSTRLVTRRKVKDSDKIFSSSSVMSFMTSTRLSKTKRLEAVKKKKRNREKFEKERKKQQNLQKRRLNVHSFREDHSMDDSTAGDENYTMSDSDAEDDELTATKKLAMKKKPPTAATAAAVTTKKNAPAAIYNKKPPVESFAAAMAAASTGKASGAAVQAPRMTKMIPLPTTAPGPGHHKPPDKPASEAGHRLRNLLTNKTPNAAAVAAASSAMMTAHAVGDAGTGSAAALSSTPKEPIKLKIMKSRLMDATIAGAGSDVVPASPAPTAAVDSGPETPDASGSSGGGATKRNRGRPKRLDT